MYVVLFCFVLGGGGGGGEGGGEIDIINHNVQIYPSRQRSVLTVSSCSTNQIIEIVPARKTTGF